MRNIIIAFSLLISANCFGQPIEENRILGIDIIDPSDTLAKYQVFPYYIREPYINTTETPFKKPIYDTARLIVVFIKGLDVKADSCFQIRKATQNRNTIIPNNCPIVGCAVNHLMQWKTEPDFQCYKTILYSTRKELDPKAVIMYK